MIEWVLLGLVALGLAKSRKTTPTMVSLVTGIAAEQQRASSLAADAAAAAAQMKAEIAVAQHDVDVADANVASATQALAAAQADAQQKQSVYDGYANTMVSPWWNPSQVASYWSDRNVAEAAANYASRTLVPAAQAALTEAKAAQLDKRNVLGALKASAATGGRFEDFYFHD